MKTIVLILLTAVSLLSCSSNTEDSATPTAINFTTVSTGTLSGNGDEGIPESNRVINNMEDWQRLMTQMNSRETQSFEEVAINFSEHLIIAVFTGIKPTKWDIEITAIEDNAETLFISTVETEFDNTIITQPYHIVRIPITDKAIEFEE